MRHVFVFRIAALGAACLACALPVGAAQGRIASVSVHSTGLAIAPHVGYERLEVSLTGPGDFALRQEFDRGQQPFVPLAGLSDGGYRWELRAAPVVDAGLREELRAAREKGDLEAEAALAARLPRALEAQSGAFTVLGGQVVPGDLREPRVPAALAADAPRPTPDTTFTDSLCVGFDCPAAPSFGDTTILMMENNTRIKYDDTSTSAGFPNRDWALNANDSASGGLNRFWIQDCGASSQGSCSGNAVFSIEAGARANALYVDDGGRLGLGTATPVLDIHNKRGNTPSLRLEQDGSSGFTAQTWDVAGNEANFFVRDVTGGSRLPFRIRPGAPTSSIDISAAGDVGISTASPSAALNVRRSNATAKVLVEDTQVTGDKVMLHLNSSADANKVRFLYQAGTKIWSLDNNGGSDTFSIAKVGGGNLTIDNAGNVSALSFNPTSDRNAKRDIAEVDPQAVLEKLAALPVSTWRFKQTDELHMGPMAQDFAAAFGLGSDETRINLTDVGGVALAAIKALHRTVGAKDALLAAQQQKLDALAAQNAELAERLAALERALLAK